MNFRKTAEFLFSTRAGVFSLRFEIFFHQILHTPENCILAILIAFELLTAEFFFIYIDELIQELERERCAKIEAERKLKGKQPP